MDYSSCDTSDNEFCVINEERFNKTSNLSYGCNQREFGPLSHKKRKFEENFPNDVVQKLRNDWNAEYEIWYKITFGKEFQSNTNICVEEKSPKTTPDTSYSQPVNDTPQTTQFCPNIDQSIFNANSQLMTPFVHTNNAHQPGFGCVPPIPTKIRSNPVSIGYWGPLLRYGTYGVFKIYGQPITFNRSNLSVNNTGENRRVLLQYSLELPLRIKMPRQAMIWTLQSKLKSRLYDLKKSEKDPILHMNINYSKQLEQVTKQCGTCPRYLFTKIKNLPPVERQYFTNLDRNSFFSTYLSLDGSIYNEIKSTNLFYGCELLIGDIIISQGFSLWKRRAREVCAKNAFRVLEKPCFIVGSTRYWYGTDYMTACTTDDPMTVSLLPPFLTDPTEPLYKKDEKINESDPEENFDILNPKPIYDFWLYATTMKPNDNIKNIDPEKLLYQSAEFSQMNLSFEVESCWDESFMCTVMIDKSPAIKVEGLGSLEQACRAAALVLVDKLVDTQPIVAITEAYHQQYINLESNSGYKNNEFLVRSLMWSQHDLNEPIDFKDLSDLISSEVISSVESCNNVSSKERITNYKDMEYLFTTYAQSSLINPVRLSKSCINDHLWENVPIKMKKCGLLIMNESSGSDSTDSFLICKQVPHNQLKAILLREKSFGVFTLISEGNLSNEYLSNLNQYIYYENDNKKSSLENQNWDERTDNTEIDSIFLPQNSYLNTDVMSDTEKDRIPGLDF